MEIKLTIPSYNPEKGFEYYWGPGFSIDARIVNGAMVITANKEGLVSLANQLLNLAQDGIPADYHIHLDENNSLEQGACDVIVSKK